jgi:hypothetical protein
VNRVELSLNDEALRQSSTEDGSKEMTRCRSDGRKDKTTSDRRKEGWKGVRTDGRAIKEAQMDERAGINAEAEHGWWMQGKKEGNKVR